MQPYATYRDIGVSPTASDDLPSWPSSRRSPGPGAAWPADDLDTRTVANCSCLLETPEGAVS